MLILDNGDVILDSYVIVEYLNEIAGGALIPDYGRDALEGEDAITR